MTRCSVGRATQKYRGNATGTGTSQWITTGDDISYSLGDVGIGTTSPDANLHVTGNAFVSTDLALGGTLTMGNVLVEALHELSAITATGNVTPHVIEFTNPTTGLVTTGNVGIGTSTPEYTLDVAGGINFTGALTQNGTSWRSSPWVISGSDISYTTGRIGVGTSTPEATLHVEGSVYASSNLNVGGTATGSAASGVEQQQKIQASDAQAYDSFGYSVSLSPDGNTALIGAHFEDTGGDNAGAAYIFTRSNGTWTQQQKIQASDAQAYDEFGYSVSISSDGNTALIGAHREDTGGDSAGAAYVFTRSNGTWSQQQKIQASDAQAYDNFGNSVSLSSDGNTALIGARYEDTGGDSAGAAYVFTRSNGTWSQNQKIQASDAQAYDGFGSSVSLSGDGNTALVGAYVEDTGGDNAGAAYIFTRSNGTWTEQQKIQASDAQAYDYFGISVSLSSDGNTVLIGANNDDTGATNAGAAYIFIRSGGTWTQQQKIQASDAGFDDYFGHSVSLSSDGNTALIGAHYEDTGGTDAGAAYMFIRSGSTWTQQHKIQASDAGIDDRFGISVSLSSNGNTALVGARYEDTGGANAGAAYIFIPPDRTVLCVDTTTSRVGIGTTSPSSTLDVIGDINFTGALTQNGTSWGSSPWVISGSGISYTTGRVGVGTSSPAYTLDVIGGINFTGALTQNGSAYGGSGWVISGSDISYTTGRVGVGTSSPVYTLDVIGDINVGSVASELEQQQKIQASDAQASDYFGVSVSLSSDGNTALFGARYEDTGSADAGAAYIFIRSSGTWSQQQKIQASDAQAYDYFGESVSLSSDGNTALVGAVGKDTGGESAGAAYIFTRSNGTWTQQQKIHASDAQAYDYFGYSVSLSSDGNTALVGAYGEDAGGTSAGAAYVFTRSNGTWSEQQKIQASDAGIDDQFGFRVSLSGDGNTALIGAHYEDTGASGAGAAYVFTRSGGTWSQQQKIQASDAQASDYFGFSVSLSSDGNTALVGARYEDTGGANAGAVYIFTRSNGTWSQQQKIQASDIQAYDNFGHSVSLSSDGNTALIGAVGEDTGGESAGAAYVFTRSNGTWSQNLKIQASDAQAYDNFGISVSLSSNGNTALVGAYGEDAGGTSAGAAYMFIRPGGTVLCVDTTTSRVGIGTTSPAYTLDVIGGINFTGALTQNGSAYGGGSSPWVISGSDISYIAGDVGIGTSSPAYTLDVAGNINFTGALTQNGSAYGGGGSGSSPWVISGSDISYTTGRVGVGTSSPDANLHVEGNVYVSSNLIVGPQVLATPIVYQQQGKIQASDAQANDYFGYSVSLSSDGNTAIVGAYLEDTVGYDAGAAYVFTRSNGTWTQQQKIQASDVQAYDNFGHSVSLSSDGNTALIGAYNEDTGASGAGAAYIFTRSGVTWSQQQKIQASDRQAYDSFGFSVSLSSDGNTALIGAHVEDAGGTDAGAAYIFTRSNGTWTQQQKIQASDAQAYDEFGYSVSLSSDGNTALVGARYEDTGGANAGAAYVFTRSNGTWSQQQKIQASDAQASDYFGYSVSLSPDGNTALIGAHYEDAGATNTGAAYVFTRSNGTWSQQQKIQASDAQASDYFGYSVSLSSDGNTALVGAYGEDTGGPQTGAAYVFTRSNGTWTQQQKIQASDAEFDDRFGHSVSLSSDGNTALIGAHYEDTGASGAGAAYIFTSTGGPGSDSVLCVDTTINRVGVGTTSPSVELHVSGTGAIIVPSGTTAERPGTLVTGMIRYNTTSLKYEGYGLYSWLDLSIADVVTELYPFTSHTFTPCNGDSRYGPQLSDALSTYGNISPWDNTNFFNIVTRGFQLWTVPKTGTYRITARGARGGEASSSYAPYITTPGSGGSVRADIALTINTQVVFIVGQTPPESTGDFRSGSGGGATWVLKPGAYTDNDDVYMVAGGGGGAGPRHYNSGTAGHADASSQGTLGVGGTSHWNGNGGGAGWTADGDPVGARGGVRPAGGAMGGTGTTHGGFGGGGSESGDSAGGGAGATGGRAALRYNSTGSDTARGGTSYITTNATNRSFLGTHGLTGGGNVYVEFIS